MRMHKLSSLNRCMNAVYNVVALVHAVCDYSLQRTIFAASYLNRGLKHLQGQI